MSCTHPPIFSNIFPLCPCISCTFCVFCSCSALKFKTSLKASFFDTHLLIASFTSASSCGVKVVFLSVTGWCVASYKEAHGVPAEIAPATFHILAHSFEVGEATPIVCASCGCI